MKRILCGLVCLLAAAALCSPVLAQELPEGMPPVYERAACAGTLELWADPGTGNFCLWDRATDARWNSAPLEAERDDTMKGAVKNRLLSLVTGTLLDPALGKETPFYSGVLAGQNKLTYARVQGGYQLQVSASGVSFSIEVLLEKDHLIVRLPAAGLEEGEIWLKDVQLAPSLGAAGTEDEGFFLVPDGCGALIRFNNGKKGSYDEPVYGADKAAIRTALAVTKQTAALPVYGIEKNANGLLAVISQGAAAANVRAAPAGNGSIYNTACASFTLREKASQTIAQNVAQTIYEPERSVLQDLELKLYPVKTPGSGYMGMAEALRDYLKNECGLQPLQAGGPAGVLTVYGGVAQKARILGVPLWEEPGALTSFERAGEMLDTLRGAGPMALELLEWEQGQILGKAAGAAQPAAALGGEKQLRQLARTCAERGIPLYGGVAAARFSSSGNGASVNKSAARSLTQEPAAQYEYGRASYGAELGGAFYLRAPGQLKAALASFAESAQALGLAGVSVTDLGAMSYSDYHKNGTVGAPESAEYAAGALRAAGQSGRVAVHGGLLFAAVNAELVLDAPSCSSGFSIEDEQVPFYQIALSGLVRYAAPPVNQQADPQQALLWSLETGSALNWAFADQELLELQGTRLAGLTGLSWKFGVKTAEAQAREYLPLLEQVAGRQITDREVLAEGVCRTRFASGAAVAVNYTDQDYQGEGFSVPAMGYRFWEKGAA